MEAAAFNEYLHRGGIEVAAFFQDLREGGREGGKEGRRVGKSEGGREGGLEKAKEGGREGGRAYLAGPVEFVLEVEECANPGQEA